MKRELLIVIGFMSLLVLSGWVEVAPIPTRRSDMACVQGEDKIYLTGGCSSDQVYETNNSVCETVSTRLDVYTPATDSWTTLAQMPRTRNRHVSAYYSGKVYVIGGRDQNDNIIQEVDVYDVQSNTWSTLPQLFTMATSDFAINVIGTKAILSGGYIQDYHDTNKTHIFNLDTATFDYNVTETTRGRGDVCGEVIGNDAFTFGGYEDTNFCSPVSTIEQFNLNKLLWSYVPTVNAGVNGGDGACFAYKGRFFAIGGEQKDSRCFSLPIASAESYDPVADSWASEPDFALPEGRFRFCGLTFNGQPYVFGGQGPLEIKGGEDSHPILAYVLTYQDPSSTASFISSSSFFVFSMLLGISLAFASGVSF